MGKLTTMEFAVGFPDPTKPFPIPRNPWDLGTWAGGSSSGSASGVAAGMVLGAIGTDTGGSIRIPSAFCGTTGLKPTYGRVPKTGCVPFAWSMDHVGPMARSASDCAAILQAVAGPHPSDESATDRPVPDYLDALGGSLEGVRIGRERTHHEPDGADPAIAAGLSRVTELLERLGAIVTDVTLPLHRETVSAAHVTMVSEGAAYHLPDLRRRWDDYAPATRRYASNGLLVSGADYVQAQRIRRVAQRELRVVFDDVDLVLTPTMTMGASRFDELLGLDFAELMTHSHTFYWDAVGNPAIAQPMGFTAKGLPVSFQLAGRPFEEALLLRVADAFQRETDWHLQLPPLGAGEIRV
jgi:aspartyl-tRNA(Asn)/glutamyl-tRNA(Gln) amidotransferase subunit A